MADKKSGTIGELRKSGYQVLTIKQELRNNVIHRIKAGEKLFPGIVGYEDSVIPQMENAILAGQDIILLGERGQAKSRLIRMLIELLDPEIPYIAGCEINDNPYNPICAVCKDKVDKDGDKVEVAWRKREERYAEKLATPDISIADLIGDIDPIKVAEGRYLSDETAIHYGLVPRNNRGIFAINELPDLSERIQVGLFNLMQERDVQIKGYRIRLPVDVYVVATANPEDYTNRGRIITPLKDRYGAQIRTHYPKVWEEEIGIVQQESLRFPDSDEAVVTPRYMQEIVAEITALARRSPEINQRSGVSVRVTIANQETLVSNAFKRGIRLGEVPTVPRVTDLDSLVPSTMGKIELESVEEGRETKVIEDLTKKAVQNVFSYYLNARDFEELILRFDQGFSVETGSLVPSSKYLEQVGDMPELSEALKRLEVPEEPAAIASAIEFILEGLHLNRKLNREKVEGKYMYKA